MASRAPTYYHWAMDKPCTTNQIYGFELKGDMQRYAALEASKPKKKLGPFDYTRPFSNIGFFPKISESVPVERRSKSVGALESSSRCIGENKFDINKGYKMGYVPVTTKIQSRPYPADVQLVDFQAIPPVYVRPKPKGKDLYLWHSLSGCLVHVRKPDEKTLIPKEVY